MMEKHPQRKGKYFCRRGTVVPPMELQKMVFTFVEDAKVHIILDISFHVFLGFGHNLVSKITLH
jgi:hypothetical protein